MFSRLSVVHAKLFNSKITNLANSSIMRHV